MLGLDALGGGIRESKFKRRRVSRAVAGVLAVTVPGVLVHAPCAGLGVTLTNSAKLKAVLGVLGPLAPHNNCVPGVCIIPEEGRGVPFAGGVAGAKDSVLLKGMPGEGDIANWTRSSAPSLYGLS